MIAILAVVLGVCLTPVLGAPPSCPEGLFVPEGLSANGMWYIQYAMPVFTPLFCSVFNTVPPCRCIHVNATTWVQDGKVNYETLHFGYNSELKQWVSVPITGIQTNVNGKMSYELTTGGKQAPSNVVFLASDNFENYATATACIPVMDITGVKKVLPYWVMTRAVQPSEAVLKAALSTLPPEVVPNLIRIPQDQCPE